MQTLATILFYLGVIAYSAASTLFFIDLVRPGPARASWGPRLLGLALGLHGGHVLCASLLSNICPVESLHFALSVSALMAGSAYLVIRRGMRIDALGALIAPLALAFLVGAQFVADGEASAPSALGIRPLLMLHIGANVLGVGLFLLAGASGAFYVVEERRLKHKRATGSSKLPPLAALDRTSHRLLLAGFPLLTFGVVTGSLFLNRLSPGSETDILRSLLGYLSWGLLAVVLVARRLIGWSGRRAAYGTLAGVGCVLLVVLVYALRDVG